MEPLRCAADRACPDDVAGEGHDFDGNRPGLEDIETPGEKLRDRPLDLLGSVGLTAVAFALLNPILEEAVFRGILHQAIAAYWSAPVTVLATALLFGIGHQGGYPPGAIGAVLAGVFGLLLGAIRHSSRGLLLPVLVHVAADATIAIIRIRAAGAPGVL